jgi:hypothetical protein
MRRNVVHSDHIFMITMRLMSKPTYFTTNSVVVDIIATCLIVYATIGRVEPNSSHRCN